MTQPSPSTSVRRAVALGVALALLLAASAMAKSAPKIDVGLAYDAAAGWGAFNAMTRLGVTEAQADFGVRLFEREVTKHSGATRDREAVLSNLAHRADLVLAVGFQYEEAAGVVAGEQPATNIAVLDGGTLNAPQDNLISTTMATNEGSFLVGAAAALTSTSGQIGFIGGMDLPVVLEFQAGFAAGISYQDATATLTAEYVSVWPDFSGFNDPDRAYDIAMAMYEDGIDVIFHAAGNSDIGLFEAARDYSQANATQVWAIGVDYDQYLGAASDLRPYILTSMVKRLDVVVYDLIKAQVDGTLTGGNHHWDLSRNGVDYATSGGFINALVPTLEAIRQDIIDGVIVVPHTP